MRKMTWPSLLVGVLAVTGAMTGTAARAQSVLFIGNSFTFADFGPQARPAGGVPELFARIAKQDGHAPEIKMVAPGGTTMHQHFDNGHGEITAIQSKKWDYVVLQGYSADATTAAPHPGEFLEYGQKIADIIKQNNPATKIVVYETWAYPKDYGVYPSKFADQAAMLDQIATGYRTLAKNIGAQVAPVGDAFYQAEMCPKKYNLYAPGKNYHSTDTGYTLSALVIERTIYGKLPADLKPVLSDIAPDDMLWLGSIADANVRAWQHATEPKQ